MQAFVIINTSTLVLLSDPWTALSQAQAVALAQQMGGQAGAVELRGLSEPWDPATSPQQTWLYNTTTKVLVRQ